MGSQVDGVYDQLPEHEREEFFQTAEEFSSRLEATIEGARNYLRRTCKKPATLHVDACRSSVGIASK